MITVTENDKTKTINMGNMKTLDIGRIRGGEYEGHVVMRTASTDKFEVMNMTESRTDVCWTKHNTLQVELFKSGEAITITAK